jgi:hypothetical protein
VTTPLSADDVRSRLGYARVRIDDLLRLNHGDLPGAAGHERQHLTQEVFFHLVGSIEVFAQLINERRNLGQPSEDVSISKLATWLPASDPLLRHVGDLYLNTRKAAPASDVYSGDGLMYRIWNYRHQVTHRRANPFQIRMVLGSKPRSHHRGFWFWTDRLRRFHGRVTSPDRSGHFLLDPRQPLDPNDQDKNVSQRNVSVEVEAMYTLVKDRLETAIATI